MRNHTPPDADKNDLLLDVLHSLRNEIAELRDAIDWLREEIQWGNRNCNGSSPMQLRFRSQVDGPPQESFSAQPEEPAPQPTEPPYAGPRRQVELW